MEFTPALILDIVLVLLLIGAVFSAQRDGFVSTIIRLAGVLVSLVVAYVASARLAPQLFSALLRSRLVEKTQQILVTGGQVTVKALVEGLAGFVPESIAERILGAEVLAGILEGGAPGMAEEVVETVIMPLFLPILSVVLFFVVFALCSLVVRFLVSLFTNLNRVPLVGFANRLLGVVLGAVLGCVRIILVLCVVWAVQSMLASAENPLAASFFYSYLSPFNPFF